MVYGFDDSKNRVGGIWHIIDDVWEVASGATLTLEVGEGVLTTTHTFSSSPYYITVNATNSGTYLIVKKPTLANGERTFSQTSGYLNQHVYLGSGSYLNTGTTLYLAAYACIGLADTGDGSSGTDVFRINGILNALTAWFVVRIA